MRIVACGVRMYPASPTLAKHDRATGIPRGGPPRDPDRDLAAPRRSASPCGPAGAGPAPAGRTHHLPHRWSRRTRLPREERRRRAQVPGTRPGTWPTLDLPRRRQQPPGRRCRLCRGDPAHGMRTVHGSRRCGHGGRRVGLRRPDRRHPGRRSDGAGIRLRDPRHPRRRGGGQCGVLRPRDRGIRRGIHRPAARRAGRGHRAGGLRIHLPGLGPQGTG